MREIHQLSTKGIPMIVDMLLAVALILSVGVAVNVLGHLVSK